ncbi:unnamed protein product, partial [Polarella glacialis]
AQRDRAEAAVSAAAVSAAAVSQAAAATSNEALDCNERVKVCVHLDEVLRQELSEQVQFRVDGESESRGAQGRGPSQEGLGVQGKQQRSGAVKPRLSSGPGVSRGGGSRGGPVRAAAATASAEGQLSKEVFHPLEWISPPVISTIDLAPGVSMVEVGSGRSREANQTRIGGRMTRQDYLLYCGAEASCEATTTPAIGSVGSKVGTRDRSEAEAAAADGLLRCSSSSSFRAAGTLLTSSKLEPARAPSPASQTQLRLAQTQRLQRPGSCCGVLDDTWCEHSSLCLGLGATMGPSQAVPFSDGTGAWPELRPAGGRSRKAFSTVGSGGSIVANRELLQSLFAGVGHGYG